MSLATTSLITAASVHVSITSMIAIVVVVVTGGGVGTGIVVAAGSSSGVGALFMDWRFGKVDESS